VRVRLLNAIAGSEWLPMTLRTVLYRRLGVAVGAECVLLPGVTFGQATRPGGVVIGQRCYINRDCWFDPGDSTITIGDHVVLASRVMLSGAGHHVGTHARRATGATSGPITIEAGCWIGAGAIILPGVSVAAGCIVGAGAVVTSSTEPDGVYVGVPARRLRTLD
jgi:maltose O-acetyltransferase